MSGIARPPSVVVLTSVSAQIFVADVRRSSEFYLEKLGFTVDFLHGEPPFYGQVQRDRALIAMRLVCEPVFAGDIRDREQLLSGAITVETATAIRVLFADYEAKGVDFQQRLAEQPWGALNFVVRDPDGNLILFAGPAR